MKRISGWDLLQSRRYKEALTRFTDDYAQNPSNGILTNIGITYLCMGDTQGAKVIFDKMLRQADPEDDDGLYAYLGLIHWLEDDPNEAVAFWKRGLNCQYRDEAGGMELPLLLLYAGVRAPKSFDCNAAIKLVSQRLESEWAENWPGPIGRFVVGQIDESEMRHCARFDVELVEKQQLVQAEFYVGVERLSCGDKDAFHNSMAICASQPGCEVLYEPFLAKHELKRQGQN